MILFRYAGHPVPPTQGDEAIAEDINTVTLVCRPTRDPEIRYTKDEKPIANMRVASTKRDKLDTGEWGDAPNYFDVVVFGQPAMYVGDYVRKGTRIGIVGVLDWHEYQTKDGQTRQAVEIHVKGFAGRVQILDSKAERQGSDMPPAAQPAGAAAGGEDIPF